MRIRVRLPARRPQSAGGLSLLGKDNSPRCAGVSIFSVVLPAAGVQMRDRVLLLRTLQQKIVLISLSGEWSSLSRRPVYEPNKNNNIRSPPPLPEEEEIKRFGDAALAGARTPPS